MHTLRTFALAPLLAAAVCAEACGPASPRPDVAAPDAQAAIGADSGLTQLDASLPIASDASSADSRTPALHEGGVVADRGTCQPGNGILMGGLRSFGFCTGTCKHELGLIYPIQLASNTCLIPQVTLSSYTRPGETSKTVTAKLTLAAWQRAVDIGLALNDIDLQPTYGCPDCADGGASTIVLDQERAGLIDSTYEYGNPPAVLAEADSFVQSLIDQMIACQGADITQCR